MAAACSSQGRSFLQTVVDSQQYRVTSSEGRQRGGASQGAEAALGGGRRAVEVESVGEGAAAVAADGGGASAAVAVDPNGTCFRFLLVQRKVSSQLFEAPPHPS